MHCIFYIWYSGNFVYQAMAMLRESHASGVMPPVISPGPLAPSNTTQVQHYHHHHTHLIPYLMHVNV